MFILSHQGNFAGKTSALSTVNSLVTSAAHKEVTFQTSNFLLVNM